MVEIDKTFQGKPFPEGLANYGPVQRVLADHAGDMARAAQAILAAHRHDGHAQIETEHGDVDWHIILSDERGQRAAMSIEFGRGPDENGNGATDGIFALHGATGLRVKAQRPRSRRRKRYRA